MTVSELIKELQKLPQDKPVMVQDCMEEFTLKPDVIEYATYIGIC